jgi:hypothetical protein
MYGILGRRLEGVSFGLKVGVTVGLLMTVCSGLAFGVGLAGFLAIQRRLFSRVRQELTITLVVALALGGVCYLGIWCYSNERSPWRSACFEECELRDPCQPKGLFAAVTNAFPSDTVVQQKMMGTWWHSQPSFSPASFHLFMITVASNGDTVSRSTFRVGDGNRTNTLEGRWEVRDGFLIETITKTSSPAGAPLPYSFTNRLLRVTERELVYRESAQGNAVVMWRKVRQANR